MTPNWNDAPEWAQWVAMDDDGEWWWYEKQPSLNNGMWLLGGGKNEQVFRTVRVEPICHPRPTTENER